MRCPLCFGSNTALQDSLGAEEIASRWERMHGIDLRSEFGDVIAVDFYRCFECRLGFFKPDSVAGSSRLYEELGRREWYYLPRKWEHDAALQDMNGARNGLEVGCGYGAFVARVTAERKIPFEGCEQNPSAVKVGESNGIPIRLERLEDIAARCTAAYDVVCSFQVLEHVTDPRGFLKTSCNLLRPGGKLMVGVPNAESSIVRFLNFFDAPPHHMTRWTGEVFRRLPRWFPLDLIRIACEPLEDSRVGSFVEANEGFFRRFGLRSLPHPRIRSLAIRLIGNPKLRRFLKGETIYACYRRR
jgi:SAM-dependent methyltransferase